MTDLETRARAAGTELRRTRGRRAGAKTLAAAAVLALAVGGWQLTGRGSDTVQPAPAVGAARNGVLLALPADQADPGVQWLALLGDAPAFVPRDGAADTAYQFSADGTELVYADREGHVEVMAVATGATRTLTDCPEDICAAALSPDGRVLASTDGDSVRLTELTTDDTTTYETPGAELGGPPAWSPDGTQLAVAGPEGIVVVDARTGELTRPGLGTLAGHASGPVSWSADGDRIAYLTGTQEPGDAGRSRFLVTVVDLARHETTALLDAGACSCFGTAAAPYLTWSPDGTRLAVTTTRGAELPRGLYLLDPTGEVGPERLASGSFAALAWQPLPG